MSQFGKNYIEWSTSVRQHPQLETNQDSWMSDRLTAYKGTVYPWHCDHVGHMNIMWYVGKFDEANWNLFAAAGLTPTYLREKNRGMAAVQQNITYKREVLAGSIVEVRSHILEVRDRSLRFVHEMHDVETGDVVASCEITGVHMDRVARKSCPFPDAVRTAAAALVPSPSLA